MPKVEVDDARLAAALRALGHPVRLELMRMLAETGDAQCLDLTRHIALSQSTVSEHLRVLKEAGLIEQCGPGHRSGYCLNPQKMKWLKKMVTSL